MLNLNSAADHHHLKQPMFEKPLTPSDVGKLNRLVIPKQYAEKYFPLSPAAVDKAGLLLTFEDESGKVWRFRYSYWNSSQSYVLTKGWSRFVKDKRLHAGHVVVFERHQLHTDRLFIGSKPPSTAAVVATGGGGGWTRMFSSTNPNQSSSNSPHPAESSVYKSETVSTGNSKILRLFGVDFECQTDVSEPEPDLMLGGGSGLSDRDPTRHGFYTHYSSPVALPRHMDLTFSQDVKQTKYQGYREEM